jgi:predicted NAD-dependent protein-ADP-ribosyltransferase YbiA (DUF1768 family)
MIDSFTSKYFFLSNFYAPVAIKDEFGLEYSSVEAAYQASKATNKLARIPFTKDSASKSKARGRQISLRPDWSSVKVDIMRGLLEQKFSRPDLKQLLKDTGKKELVEGNDWNEAYVMEKGRIC